MNKFISISGSILIIAAVFVFIGFTDNSSTNNSTVKMNKTDAAGLKPVAGLINSKKSNYDFPPVNLFSLNNNAKTKKTIGSFVTKAAFLKIDNQKFSAFQKSPSENITFRIPDSKNGFMELELTRVNILTNDFKLTSKNSLTAEKQTENFTPGLFYRGIIKGDNNSVASVSIFENDVMGIISDKSGNYVLGKIEDKDNPEYGNFIFYNDGDILTPNPFKCSLDGNDSKYIKPVKAGQNENSFNTDVAQLPVKVYFEADYKLYTDKGSTTQNVYNYVTGFYNSVVTLYSNESISFLLSEVLVWTQTDPYISYPGSDDVLIAFGTKTKDNFQGTLAHLLSTRTDNLGGIAWIRVLCQPYNQTDNSGRFAFSNIDNTYQGYPTFSWTVMVVTHEMGHNLGSMHTHACAWPIRPGVIGAIDSCYAAEGNCFFGTRAAVGTVMSYCHLTSGGINLFLGFGPMPGDTVRLRYGQANCLTRELNSSEQPVAFVLGQNFPNPYNPGTNIRFSVPKDANVTLKVFDISGREIANLIGGNLYITGIYSYYFNAGNYSMPSGTYLYQLTATDPSSGGKVIFSEVKKMILIK